ncbi:hypothetical protein [Intrasporangium sp. DVR]|uniref:hypothetical protein n=1 Tax=Intrasporangium sp. DVR TaxID=3127867 RepID=UPI00313A5931
MLKRTIASAAAAVALGGAGLLVAPTASAAGVEQTRETLDFTIENHPYFSGVCGFPITVHVWGEFLVNTWYDESGAPTREMRLFNFRSTSEANGVVINGSTMGPDIATYHPDGSATIKILGTVHRRVPGAGTVRIQYGFGLLLRSADGETEVSIVENGSEDLAPLCDALAG